MTNSRLESNDVHGFAVAANGARTLFATTNAGLHTSADGGETWTFTAIDSEWQYTRSILSKPGDPDVMLLTNGIRRFAEKCVAGISADVACNERHLMDSMAVATALVPKLGYARVSKLARQSVADGRPLVEILDESGLLSRDDTLSAIDAASYPVFEPR